MIEEALRQQQTTTDEDTPLKVDMHAESLVQLAATDPRRVPLLPPQLVRVCAGNKCV